LEEVEEDDVSRIFVLLIDSDQSSQNQNQQSLHLALDLICSTIAQLFEIEKTSQDLRMLSSVTPNCQATKKCHEFRISIFRIVLSVSNVTSLCLDFVFVYVIVFLFVGPCPLITLIEFSKVTSL